MDKVTKRISQKQIILEYLLSGKTLTPLQAYKLCGTIRLGAYIHELRHKDNYPIKNLNPRSKHAIYAI